MTSLKSIQARRTLQVLGVRDMQNLKGGLGIVPEVLAAATTVINGGSGGYPPDPDKG